MKLTLNPIIGGGYDIFSVALKPYEILNYIVLTSWAFFSKSYIPLPL